MSQCQFSASHSKTGLTYLPIFCRRCSNLQDPKKACVNLQHQRRVHLLALVQISLAHMCTLPGSGFSACVVHTKHFPCNAQASLYCMSGAGTSPITASMLHAPLVKVSTSVAHTDCYMYSWVFQRVCGCCSTDCCGQKGNCRTFTRQYHRLAWDGIRVENCVFVGHAGICRTPMRQCQHRAPASSCCTVWWRSCLPAMQTAPQLTPTACSWAGFWMSLLASSAS